MTRFSSWIVLLLVFAVLIGTAYYLLSQRAGAGREMPPYSVYSEDENGLAEAARFLEKLGWQPVALTRPISQVLIDANSPQLLIIVEPQPSSILLGMGEAISKAEARSILRWVSAGNTLLRVGRRPTGVHDELQINLTSDWRRGPDEGVRQVDLEEGGAYTENIEQLLVQGRDSVQAAGSLPLWSQNDRPGALLLRHGRGRVLVIADPSLLTRRGLIRGDNALFLYNIVRRHAPDRRVWFDEYHHGIRSGGGFWGYLRHHGEHWLLLPVLAAVAVAAWSVMVRLGPAVSPPQPVQADAVDYASALARIYQRAKIHRRLVEVLTRDFLTVLTKAVGIRRSALPAEILAAWHRQQPDADLKRLQTLLHTVSDLRRGNPRERQLHAAVREFDQWVKECGGLS
jgi:hypothetical protein